MVLAGMEWYLKIRGDDLSPSVPLPRASRMLYSKISEVTWIDLE